MMLENSTYTMSFTTTQMDHDYVIIPMVPVIIGGIVLTSFSLYLVIVLTIYQIRKVKQRKKESREATRARSLALASSARGKNSKHFGKEQNIIPRDGGPGSVRLNKAKSSACLDNLSLIASILALLNCLSDNPIAYSTFISTEACKILQLLSYLFYSSGHVCVYLFLWARQRACYKNRSLALMHSKFSRVLSAIILPIFLIMTVAGVILTGVSWSFDTSPNGCVQTEKNRIPLILHFAGATTMQITLFALFIYPLKHHTKMLLDRTTIISRSEQLLTDLIKRSIVTTVVCIVADTFAFVFAMLVDYHVPFIIINYIYDANLICNVVSVLGSFADWRRRLLPCCVSNHSCYPKFSIYSAKTSSTNV